VSKILPYIQTIIEKFKDEVKFIIRAERGGIKRIFVHT